MKLVTRSAMKWPAFHGTKAPCNKGIVVHYDGNNQGLAKDHDKCVDYWQATRKYHMVTNGWLDIGYSYGVCPHGNVFEGRGFGWEQAAQRSDPGKMPHGNTDYVSVTFMSGKTEKPTVEQTWAFVDLCEVLVQKHGVKFVLFEHRDFSDTDCPGPILSALVPN